MRVLRDVRIVLGVTGSIAAYKAVYLASELVKGAAVVDVVMTDAAAELVRPLSFQAITHRPVVRDMFTMLEGTDIGHVTLASEADLLLVAPATANTIAKLAAGLADNMLSAVALATTAPIVLAPAMESHMYNNPATRENLDRLRQRGVTIVEPEVGRLASGAEGVGRLAALEEILGITRQVLGRGGDLAGQRVLVTAGGTEEPLDPVRYLSNYSSGAMGYALARAARDRGAAVTLVSAPTSLHPPAGVLYRSVRTAQEMRDAVLGALSETDVLIMAAAVADYRPAQPSTKKIKKGEDDLTLTLARNPDILQEVAASHGGRLITVGFAAESEDLIANARSKLQAKGLDLIVANRVPASFGQRDVEAVLVHPEGAVERLPPLSKPALSERVLDRVVTLVGGSVGGKS